MTTNTTFSGLRLATLSLATAGVLLAACASTPPPDDRLNQLQTQVDSYRNNPTLVAGAPLAVSQADQAVARADSLQGKNGYEGALYDATQKVAIVRANAERLAAQADIDRLNGERTQIQLDARTAEANRARADAAAAQVAAANALSDATAARAAAAEVSTRNTVVIEQFPAKTKAKKLGRARRATHVKRHGPSHRPHGKASPHRKAAH